MIFNKSGLNLFIWTFLITVQCLGKLVSEQGQASFQWSANQEKMDKQTDKVSYEADQSDHNKGILAKAG